MRSLSERIDGVLPEEMLLFAAEILNREPEDVKQGLIELSLAIRLLPTETRGCVRDILLGNRGSCMTWSSRPRFIRSAEVL